MDIEPKVGSRIIEPKVSIRYYTIKYTETLGLKILVKTKSISMSRIRASGSPIHQINMLDHTWLRILLSV